VPVVPTLLNSIVAPCVNLALDPSLSRGGLDASIQRHGCRDAASIPRRAVHGAAG